MGFGSRPDPFQKAIDLDTGNVWTADLLGNLSYALKNWGNDAEAQRAADAQRHAKGTIQSFPEGVEPLLAAFACVPPRLLGARSMKERSEVHPRMNAFAFGFDRNA
jgi:hypothetical protein